MPSWSPNWHDVGFDHAGAVAAIDALRSTAALLDRQVEHRMRLAAAAQQEWRGPARATFDDEFTRLVRRAGDLAEACRIAAVRISDAAEAARVEQRRRVEQRERWHDERRREALRSGRQPAER